MIGIEGDDTTDLPETVEGAQAFRIERPYAMAKLRERLAEIVAFSWKHDGPDRYSYLRTVGELVEKQIFPHLGVTVPRPTDDA